MVEVARALFTKFEPEVFVPPLPGSDVRLVLGEEREEALGFNGMERKIPVGLSRAGEVVYANFDFIDGARGGHVSVSGISGVATKTSYLTFLLYSMLSMEFTGINDRALVFNVKGQDLLFLDKENANIDEEQRQMYEVMGLRARPFEKVAFFVPPRKTGKLVADSPQRLDGVEPYCWSLYDFCDRELLPFLFGDGEDSRQQYSVIVHNVTVRMKRECKRLDGGGVGFGLGMEARNLGELHDIIENRLDLEGDGSGVSGGASWLPRNTAAGTVGAFMRRLRGALPHVGHLIRGDLDGDGKGVIDSEAAQVMVVDISNLNERAQRFVVGVLLRERVERHERVSGLKTFVMLDELNKFAPRTDHSTIEGLLLDIAERGRSLGIILLGAQQTASEVERRIVSNASIRVVGRMDAAEVDRSEYGWLPREMRYRTTIVRPGTMFVAQPEIPVPLVVRFPYPSWATRKSEVAEVVGQEDFGDAFSESLGY